MISHSHKICLIYNYAQHYRIGIFKLLDQELSCDFYFGDQMDDVKKLDYSELKNFKKAKDYLEMGLDYIVDNPTMEANFYLQLSETYNGLGDLKKKETYLMMAQKLVKQNK